MIREWQKNLLTEEDKQQFKQYGFVFARGLFSQDEIIELKDNFMTMHSGGPIEGCFDPVPAEEAGGDVLKLYPRMMHPHKVNETALHYMVHPKIMSILADLFGEEPLAAQSMFYFKPPGARGQALHQDNFYLKVEPGTCIAAWVAVDDADMDNGGLVIVPESNGTEIQCPKLADPKVSFTTHLVEVPEGMSVMPADLKAGDVLFFNGDMIHGSSPNGSTDRFRRAFIGHYAGESAVRIGGGYNPLYAYDGNIVKIEDNPDSGPCGIEAPYVTEAH